MVSVARRANGLVRDPTQLVSWPDTSQGFPLLPYNGSDALRVLYKRDAVQYSGRHLQNRRAGATLLAYQLLRKRMYQQGTAHDQRLNGGTLFDGLAYKTQSFDVEEACALSFIPQTEKADTFDRGMGTTVNDRSRFGRCNHQVRVISGPSSKVLAIVCRFSNKIIGNR